MTPQEYKQRKKLKSQCKQNANNAKLNWDLTEFNPTHPTPIIDGYTQILLRTYLKRMRQIRNMK